jgi:hypothetical protein
MITIITIITMIMYTTQPYLIVHTSQPCLWWPHRWTDRHQMDRYDHIWGVFITAAGKRCRLDLMFIPPEYWTYALVGECVVHGCHYCP